jgi:hypothetical protein
LWCVKRVARLGSWLAPSRFLAQPARMARQRFKPGAVPTLEKLREHQPWLWVDCAASGCHHRKPMALVPLIIRWGPGASSDVLRKRARCTKCGHLGADLMTPSVADAQSFTQPWPKAVTDQRVSPLGLRDLAPRNPSA